MTTKVAMDGRRHGAARQSPRSRACRDVDADAAVARRPDAAVSLRAAVIGAGSMGRAHMRCLAQVEGVELVATVDTNLRAAQEAAAGIGEGVRAFADLPTRSRCWWRRLRTTLSWRRRRATMRSSRSPPSNRGPTCCVKSRCA